MGDVAAVIPSSERSARFLFAMFQGGGNIPLILPVAAELVTRGHEVRVLAGPGIRAGRLPISDRFRERIAAAGATFVPHAAVLSQVTAMVTRRLGRCLVPRSLSR